MASAELLQVPPGKGLAKWHQTTNAIFFGIDHTAIVVSDTEASLRFLGDILGLTVLGNSKIYGTEQEHLNQIFGTRLHITALPATNGPGIKLLEHLAPTDGRPLPVSARDNDLHHWHTKLVTPQFSILAQRFHGRSTSLLSASSIE